MTLIKQPRSSFFSRRKQLIGSLLVIVSLIPIGTSKLYSNLGVKRRPIGQAIVAEAADATPILTENAYSTVASYKPFVLEAAQRHKVPAITLLAILFEEDLHRKPVDFTTFGPAQLGLGELKAQGLPPRVELLEDPEIAIFILAAKLDRLRKQYGSMKEAIILHNGYDDYFSTIEKRQKDPRLLQILFQQTVQEYYVV